MKFEPLDTMRQTIIIVVQKFFISKSILLETLQTFVNMQAEVYKQVLTQFCSSKEALKMIDLINLIIERVSKPFIRHILITILLI